MEKMASPIASRHPDDAIYGALQDGDVKVIARFARRDNEEGSAPDYGEPTPVTLEVTRRKKTIKHGGVSYLEGDLQSVYVKDFGWADYSERDYDTEFHEFLAEEWRMEIVKIGW